MDIDDLFKPENKGMCRWLGVIFIGVPILFKASSGQVAQRGVSGWMGEWFGVALAIMLLSGILLLLLSFGKGK